MKYWETIIKKVQHTRVGSGALRSRNSMMIAELLNHSDCDQQKAGHHAIFVEQMTNL